MDRIRLLLNHPLTRRQALKALGAGTLTLAAARALPAFADSGANVIKNLDAWRALVNPVDRSLPHVAPKQYFGENPAGAHKILWDKQAYLTATAGQVKKEVERTPVVIIGGGLSGLFSAYLLRQHSPILLELDDRLGGVSRGQSWQGIDYAIGAAYFVEPEQGTPIHSLLAELGLDKEWKIVEGDEPFELGGSVRHDLWNGEAAAEAKEQFAALGKYLTTVNEGEEIPFPDIPPENEEGLTYIKGLDGISLIEQLEKQAGGKLHPVLESFVEQYCWSSFGGSAGEIGAASGLNFLAAELGNIAVLPAGNAAVAERVVDRLIKHVSPANIRTSCLVYDIQVKADGVQVQYRDRTGQNRRILARSAVVTCPKFIAQKLIGDLESDRLRAIKRLRYRSYLVGNVLLKGKIKDSFYDMYMLGDGKVDRKNIEAETERRGITDVILADYAKPNKNHTVLTLYRGFPYDGADVALLDTNSYERFRKEFEEQIQRSILPLLGANPQAIVDMRLARWGHPLPLAATGLIAEGVPDILRRPFRERVFFIQQDNWALPAFETSASEALIWSAKVNEYLKKA